MGVNFAQPTSGNLHFSASGGNSHLNPGHPNFGMLHPNAFFSKAQMGSNN
jgi:hypothetical protein